MRRRRARAAAAGRRGSRRAAAVVLTTLTVSAATGCSPLAAVPHADQLRRVNAERTEDPAADEPAGVLPLSVTRPVRDPAVSDSTVCAGTGPVRPPAAYLASILTIELSTPVGRSGSITDPRSGRRYRVPGYRGYAALGPADAGHVELDALLPVALGGDGYDPANLWPERTARPGVRVTGSDGKPADSAVKDRFETWTADQVCSGAGGTARLSLRAAQALFEPDWYASYVRLGRPG